MGGSDTSNGVLWRFRYFLQYFNVFLVRLRFYNVVMGGSTPGASGIIKRTLLPNLRVQHTVRSGSFVGEPQDGSHEELPLSVHPLLLPPERRCPERALCRPGHDGIFGFHKPSPATHAVLAVSKAGETLYLSKNLEEK